MMNLIRKTLLCLSLGATLAVSTAFAAPSYQPDANDVQGVRYEESSHEIGGYSHSSHHCDSCSSHSCQRCEPKGIYCRDRCERPGLQECNCHEESESRHVGVDYGSGQAQWQGTDNNVIDVTKRMNSWVQLGDEFCLQLRAQAYADTENVVIKTTIPAGAEYVDSDPKAQVVDNELIWRLNSIHCGDNIYLNAWFNAVDEGDIQSCTTVHTVPVICTCGSVGDPDLRIVKQGPEVVVEGDHVNYTITVSNEGTYPAYDVVLTDDIPEGFYHQSGQSTISYDLGSLCPGACQTINIPVCALDPGKNLCNRATVTSSNAGEHVSEVCTDILDMGIEITKQGTETLYIGKDAHYDIVVTNTGENTLTNVVITDYAPEGTSISGSPDAAWDYDRATWEIDVLSPGETRSFSVSITRDCTGFTTNHVYVETNEGASAEAAFETEWLGFPALSVHVSDLCDPIIEGEGTYYIIRVSNKGTAPDSNIQITARFSDELKPIEASGFTKGEIAGQAVLFDPVACLDPMEYVEYKVYCDAIRVGEGRARIDLRSDNMKEPVSDEENTHIY